MSENEGSPTRVGGAGRMQIRGVSGDMLDVLVSSVDTGGRYSVVMVTVAPGGGPPLHRKTREEEIMFVIDGVFEFEIGDERISGGRSALIVAPKNVTHRFRNVGNTDGHILALFVPGGVEMMSLEIAQMSDQIRSRPQAIPDVLEKFGIYLESSKTR